VAYFFWATLHIVFDFTALPGELRGIKEASLTLILPHRIIEIRKYAT